MVSHYLTIKLIGREHIPGRKTFHHPTCIQWSYPVLITVSGGYPKARGRLLTCYSPVRRSSTPKGLSARLACVKHAASVRPEPGSNSPSKNPNQSQGRQPESLSKKPRHHNHHPKRQQPNMMSTGHNKLIRRLIKHTVEFSRIRRTRSSPAFRWLGRGATCRNLPGSRLRVNSLCS